MKSIVARLFVIAALALAMGSETEAVAGGGWRIIGAGAIRDQLWCSLRCGAMYPAIPNPNPPAGAIGAVCTIINPQNVSCQAFCRAMAAASNPYTELGCQRTVDTTCTARGAAIAGFNVNQCIQGGYLFCKALFSP